MSHTSSCPALLTSAHCYTSQPHLAIVQSLLRLAGTKLSWENTQVDSFLCPLPFPPSELLAFLPLTSPHLIPRGKCSGWPFKDNYWWDGIFLCNADEIDFIDSRTHPYKAVKCIFPSGSLKIRGKDTRKTEKLGGLVKKEGRVIGISWTSIMCQALCVLPPHCHPKCSHLSVLNPTSEKDVTYIVSSHLDNNLVS